jgi:sialate O-acetylesterase
MKSITLAATVWLLFQSLQIQANEGNLYLLQCLKGTWSFSIGINSDWISPGYNDSNWETIRVPSSWEDQGFNGYNGYAFYRKKISIPSEQKGRMLYLNMGYIDDVDEVYLNGHKIGSTGGFPPNYVTATMRKGSSAGTVHHLMVECHCGEGMIHTRPAVVVVKSIIRRKSLGKF